MFYMAGYEKYYSIVIVKKYIHNSVLSIAECTHKVKIIGNIIIYALIYT